MRNEEAVREVVTHERPALESFSCPASDSTPPQDTAAPLDRLAEALAEHRAREAWLTPEEKAARLAEYERQRLRLAAAGLASPDGFIRAVSARFLLRLRGAA